MGRKANMEGARRGMGVVQRWDEEREDEEEGREREGWSEKETTDEM